MEIIANGAGRAAVASDAGNSQTCRTQPIA